MINENKGGLTLQSFMNFILWVAGILVSLAVGFSMTTGGALNDSIPYIPSPVTAITGWIVILFTFIGTILVIINRLID